jgi:hypothetical protein
LSCTFSTRRQWVLVLIYILVSLIAVFDVATVSIALYGLTSGLNITTSGKDYLAPTAALLHGV